MSQNLLESQSSINEFVEERSVLIKNLAQKVAIYEILSDGNSFSIVHFPAFCFIFGSLCCFTEKLAGTHLSHTNCT